MNVKDYMIEKLGSGYRNGVFGQDELSQRFMGIMACWDRTEGVVDEDGEPDVLSAFYDEDTLKDAHERASYQHYHMIYDDQEEEA